MFKPDQLREYVIRPALERVGLYSESAEQLLVGTCCAESRLGTYLHQVRGPALGIYQMEPATHEDIWSNWLKYRPEEARIIRELIGAADWQGDRPNHALLITDLRYATIMARLKYYRSPKQLPQVDDWHGAASLWKQVYNCPMGAGTELHFMDSLLTCGVL